MSMGQFNWYDYDLQKIHHAELLRIAAQARMAKEIKPARGNLSHTFRQALYWLGRRLVAWGARLQERYGSNGEAPATAISRPLPR